MTPMAKVMLDSTAIANFTSTSAGVNSIESDTYIAYATLPSAPNPSSTVVVTASNVLSVSPIAGTVPTLIHHQH